MKRLGLIIIGVLISFYGYQCITKGNDFMSFYDIGNYALRRENIYQPSRLTGMPVFYMPYFSILMIPFALLPLYWSALVWFLLKPVCYKRIFNYYRSGIVKHLQEVDGLYRRLILLLPFIIMINSINEDFKLGQVNIFIHFFLLSSVFLLENRKWASAFLYVLSCIKMTPLIFIPYFLVKKQWGLLLRIFIVFSVFGLICIGWFGVSQTETLAISWIDTTSKNKLKVAISADMLNQSILGFCSRMLNASYQIEGPLLQFHIADLSDVQVKFTVYLILAVLTILTLLAIKRYSLTSRMNELEISTMLVLMLLVSPDTRTAHMIHLLFPIMLLSKVSLVYGYNKKIGFTAILTAFLFFTATGKDITGVMAYNFIKYYSFQTFGLLVIFIAVLSLLSYAPSKIGNQNE